MTAPPVAPEPVPAAPAALPASRSKPATHKFRLPGSPSFSTTDEEGERSKLDEFLVASLQTQNVLVLCGSGTSFAAGGPSMSELWTKAIDATPVPERQQVFSAVGYAPPAGQENLEELLSRCDALGQLAPQKPVQDFRQRTVALILDECRKAGTDPAALAGHRTFLRRLARRRARDPRLRLFTTNYDLCFERAASTLNLVPIDGFSFVEPRRFDPRFFEYDVVVRSGDPDHFSFVPGVFLYLKLHGSVNWASRNRGTEIDERVKADEACLTYPASTKYQRSFQQPHLELMAQFLSSLRRSNTCLLVCGFGFADDHISEPILSGLETNPHLRVIIADPSADAKLANPPNANWTRIKELAELADLALFAVNFKDLAELLPDLRALSPGEQLERAIKSASRSQ